MPEAPQEVEVVQESVLDVEDLFEGEVLEAYVEVKTRLRERWYCDPIWD